jgi:hypothetical protein
MSDKRKAKRAPIDIYLNKYMGGVPYLTRASDISQEGLSLAQLIEPQHHARRVGLQFQLPGSEEVIYAEGGPSWTRPATSALACASRS